MQQSLAAEIALKLKVHMCRTGVKPGQLAGRIDVSYIWLYRRLHGEVEMTLTDLERIARGLDLSAADLIALAEPAA